MEDTDVFTEHDYLVDHHDDHRCADNEDCSHDDYHYDDVSSDDLEGVAENGCNLAYCETLCSEVPHDPDCMADCMHGC